MNLYFLVEGRQTEKKIYPKWLKYLIPQLKRVEYYHQVQKNNYYLISGKGYPRILSDGLDNAIDKIQEMNNYNYLVLCIDVDEETIESRMNYINDFIEQKKIDLGDTKIKIILQNRCIETWLLGNKKIFNSIQSLQPPLLDYVNYYDVSQNDPELMGNYDMINHATFHYQYLKAILKVQGIEYTKKFPRGAYKEDYLKEIIKRVEETNHLQTFQNFFDFCRMIKRHLSK